MIETCARCGKQSAKLEECDYCKKRLCIACIKSSKRKKVGRLHICKDCWGDVRKMKKFKGAGYRQE